MLLLFLVILLLQRPSKNGSDAVKLAGLSKDFQAFYWRVAVMRTLPLLAGDLRFFASSPALPLCYINLPLFTSTINIEYLVKNKTDLV